MKKYINFLLILFTFLSVSCGSFQDITNDQKFIAPVQKNHPRLLYPKVAQEHSITGNSKILIHINETGTVDKVDVTKSSGYFLLDNAAIQYGKDLIFEPALRNGKPAFSRVEMEVKFNIAKPDYDPNLYIQAIKFLYKQLEYADASEKIDLQRKILQKHNEFIANNGDGLNFNLYIEKILSPKIVEEWSTIWNGYPLSFLLYHDFITRFPDYDSLDFVKQHLRTVVEEDVNFINNSVTSNNNAEIQKENLLLRIENFVKNKYPDVIIKNTEYSYPYAVK